MHVSVLRRSKPGLYTENNAWLVALRWIRRKKYPDLYTASHTKCLASFIPRPLPDFILQLWRKLRVFLSCETKSGSGLGTRLSLSYCFSMGFIRVFYIWVVGIRWFEERRTLEEVNVRWSVLFLVHNRWSMNEYHARVAIVKTVSNGQFWLLLIYGLNKAFYIQTTTV